MVFPVVMYGCESWTKENWALKNWCFWTVMLKTLENPLDCEEVQPVHPGRSVLCVLRKDWCWSWNCNTLATSCEELTHWKRPWCWRDWGQEKGTTEDEMAGWHHQLDEHGFEWTLGVGDGQGGLVCCDSWGCKEWDRTEWLNWTELSANEWAEKLYDIQRSYKEKILRGLACELGLEEWPALWWTELEKKTQGVEIGSPKAGNKCDGKQCNMATD